MCTAGALRQARGAVLLELAKITPPQSREGGIVLVRPALLVAIAKVAHEDPHAAAAI